MRLIALILTFTLGSSVHGLEALTLEQIAGGPVEKFKVPNKFHHPGAMHDAMYRVYRNGEAHLIKIEFPAFEGPEADKKAERQLQGMRLAESVGGPQIVRAGRFKDEFGDTGYYVEMKEIFAGKNSFTFKGLQFSELYDYIRFRKPPAFTKVQLDKMAALIRQALEHEIDPGPDVDLIFSEDDVRWIDGSFWTRVQSGHFALEPYLMLFYWTFRLSQQSGEHLLQSFINEVRTSKVWDNSQKQMLITEIQGLTMKAIFDQPAKPFYRRCLDLLLH